MIKGKQNKSPCLKKKKLKNRKTKYSPKLRPNKNLIRVKAGFWLTT